jgi:crotonobetainyl-CoA:carnitine CoA-transferase CaiB-like acyl-CoA transferase
MTKAGKVPYVTRRLEEVIGQKTSEEWCRILMENDIPNERLFHSSEVAEDRQAWANGYLEMVDYPDSETAVPVPPVQFSDYDTAEHRILGEVGADTDTILTEAGYSPEEIAHLRECGAIR